MNEDKMKSLLDMLDHAGQYTDSEMECILNDKELLDRYFMVEDQNEREAPPNILPLLREKGLIE